MKSTRGLLVGTGLALVMALSVVFPAMAQDSTATPDSSMTDATAMPSLIATTDFFVNSAFVVNVRSGPGTEYTIVGKLRPGDGLDVTGQNADGSWIRVNFNGQEAWVAESVVVVVGDLSTAPVAEAGESAVLRDTTASGEMVEDASVIATASFNISLREQPTVNSTRLTVIPFNSELAVLARDETNRWVQVTFEDNTGWVAANLLFFSQGTMDSLPAMLADGSMMSADEFNAMSMATEEAMDDSMSATATP